MKKSTLRRRLARAERDIATKARILATYADVLADKQSEIKRLRVDVLWQAEARETAEANLETVTVERDRLTAERDDAVTQLGQIGIALAVCPDENILERISYGRRLAQEQIARLTAENARLEDVITGYSYTSEHTLQSMADARIGRLVRAMPPGWSMWRGCADVSWSVNDGRSDICEATPEQALAAAGVVDPRPEGGGGDVAGLRADVERLTAERDAAREQLRQTSIYGEACRAEANRLRVALEDECPYCLEVANAISQRDESRVEAKRLTVERDRLRAQLAGAEMSGALIDEERRLAALGRQVEAMPSGLLICRLKCGLLGGAQVMKWAVKEEHGKYLSDFADTPAEALTAAGIVAGDVAVRLRAEEQPATTRILPTSGVTVKERPPCYFVDDSDEIEAEPLDHNAMTDTARRIAEATRAMNTDSDALDYLDTIPARNCWRGWVILPAGMVMSNAGGTIREAVAKAREEAGKP